MESKVTKSFTAFADARKVASGELRDVALKAKKHLQENAKSSVLIFDDSNSSQVEIDFRGTPEAVVKRIDATTATDTEDPDKKAGPGRPKLGVVAREITLLPHHWDWLAGQPGGASVTLRKLVEDAKKKNFAKDQIRLSQEAAHKFMTAMAGNLADFEESLRALYAKDREKFTKQTKTWPKDIRDHALKLAKAALGD